MNVLPQLSSIGLYILDLSSLSRCFLYYGIKPRNIRHWWLSDRAYGSGVYHKSVWIFEEYEYGSVRGGLPICVYLLKP
jgi:hypothetical protein